MSKIILQNIDNIEEYYVPINNNVEIDSGILDIDKKLFNSNNDIINKLNKYLKKYKYNINTNDILYTFYDIYNDNIIKCIIADYKKEGDNNSIYIIQIKDDFFNNNKKLFNKKNKIEVIEKLQNTYNNTILTKLLQ